jgi:hypothetical protein
VRTECATNVEGGFDVEGRALWMRCCTGDGGGPSGAVLQGEASNHRKLRRLRAGVVSVAGKGAPVSASGVGREGERKRTTDDVSKLFLVTSKPGSSVCSGMSLGGACLLPRWCPACRWRELGPGSGVERGNLSPRYDGRSLGVMPPGRERERSKWWKPRGVEYWLRGTGADRLVVAVKPGNAGGAKGTACPGLLGGQP